MAILLEGELLGGRIKDRIQARKEAKKSGGGNPSVAEKALIKRFGDKFKNATAAQKKQLIVMFFSPIPPITKRLLMARVLAKGAISKDKIKKGAKVALRFATGGASILAEKVAQRAKARKEANAAEAMDSQVDSEQQEELFDETAEQKTVSGSSRMTAAAAAAARAKAARGSGRKAKPVAQTLVESNDDNNDGGDDDDSGDVVDQNQIISKDILNKSGSSFDFKKYAIPILGAGAAIFFFMSQNKKKR